MPPLLIAATTPDAPGFAALRIESLEQHFNMLRRLAENWQSGKNRFNAPGETLLGAFVNHQLVGYAASIAIPSVRSRGPGAFATSTSANAIVAGASASSCWSRLSPTPAPGSTFSTPMPRRRPGPFMKGLVSARCTMNRG
ncbi:putative acyltransferase [Klebsiella pneumoniae]|nr:putative acyltransferase [Klebsiella pneumoniae]